MKFKFYNPFKPHIVETEDGKFAIREFSLLGLGWDFWDRQDKYKWSLKRHIKYWCLFNTLDEAKAKLQKHYESKKKLKFKVVHK